MQTLTVQPIPASTSEVVSLVSALDEELAAGYAPENRHGLSLDAIFQPHVRFFIARLDGKAVGCAGVAFFEGFAELKRMYVSEPARGRGVAQTLLARIEDETLKSGRTVLRLETGDGQLAALRVYERAGFRRCGVFGDYAAMQPHTISASVFMEKRLGRDVEPA
jgi:putative acetyltransferase